ncbi:MAG: hypothetical protein Q8L57_02240, partial [bacterium]|nr:hypothetical protein [bacterium]
MPLEEIEKKLYREEFEGPKKEKEVKKFEEEPEFESWHPEEPKEVKQSSPALPEKPVAPPKSRRRLILIGLFALFLILVGSSLYFWYIYFPQNRVEIVLFGPKEVRAGEIATYLVRYKNNTRTIL